MFTFYDFEVFKYDWLVVFETEGVLKKIHNDVNELKAFLKSVKILVGFNNYHYDDLILASILINGDVFNTSKSIITGNRLNLKLNLPSLDVMQELPQGISLKVIEANLNLNIHETPIDFNIDRALTDNEIENVFKYCTNDVLVTKNIFKMREDYFISKLEIVETYKLSMNSIKKTRAGLASLVLQCKKTDLPNDRLYIKYDKNLDLEQLPSEIVNFYKNLEYEYRCGTDPNLLERRQLKFILSGIEHTYALGGLHGAINNFEYEGKMMNVDVSSFYPSLMINNDFISRTSKATELYEEMYNERLRLKRIGDSKEKIYKILLNATFGAMKTQYNMLYDPLQANSICINGQLILTKLILDLNRYSKLIQTNTDGILISYEDFNKSKILDILDIWQEQFKLKLDISYAIKIAQRDVNNYVIKFENGEIKTKGRFKNHKGDDYLSNSLAIIDKCMYEYYINQIPIQNTILDAYKNNNLGLFSLIAKAGRTFIGIVHEVEDDYIPLQRVNRVFATTNHKYGSVYKIKLINGEQRFHKIANCSEHCIIHNDHISTFDKTKLDLDYYIDLVKQHLFKGDVYHGEIYRAKAK